MTSYSAVSTPMISCHAEGKVTSGMDRSANLTKAYAFDRDQRHFRAGWNTCYMDQIDDLRARTVDPQAGQVHTDANLHQVASTRQADGDIPKTSTQAVSRVISDLWELSTTHLEFGKWPLSYFRNRRYKKLLSNY